MKEDTEDKITVSAPGKIILSGEHAVVYGKPAILAAINRRLFVSFRQSSKNEIITSESPKLTEFARDFVLKSLGKSKEKLRIEISSEIPIGCGMGSSAALAVAMTTALFEYLNKPFDKEKINQIAYEIEKKQHGTPSGGDNTISTYGGFLWYRKEIEFLKLFEKLKFVRLPKFVLINTGRPMETTGEMVLGVRKLYEQNKIKTEKILNEIEKTTKQLLVAFNQMDEKLVKITIRENERLLENLGVVSNFAKKIVREIEKQGGADKICGAGGKKEGAGIILAFHSKKEALFKIAKKKNLPAFEVKLGEEGVRIEKS
jgi:mevalonate kinase